MKKTICLVLAFILVAVCFAGCGDEKKVAETPVASKLVIATSPDFPPFEELKSDGKVEGIEIDILNLICEKLGMELVIEQVDFDSVLPGVQAGKYDVGVSGISVTEERQKNVLFTDPYCLAAQAIVVVDGSSISSKADLEGKKVSVQTGTTAESFCMSEGYAVSSFAANSDAEMALVTEKVNAWVIDDLTAAEMVAAYNKTADVKLVILEEAMTTEPYAFAFAKTNTDLCTKVTEALNALVKDGTVKKTFEKFEAPYTSPIAG